MRNSETLCRQCMNSNLWLNGARSRRPNGLIIIWIFTINGANLSATLFGLKEAYFRFWQWNLAQIVLELCCGGGFNAKFFYSYKAGHIISCDFDPKAILHAQTYNMTAKTQFVLADIRTDMPAGKFDNIIWDGSLPYFSESEIQKLISDITNRLAVNGIFSGYVQCVHQPQYKHEFQSKDDLKRFLEPYFAHVKIFETIYPDRHNLYFYASNGILPFDSDWKHITEK